MTQLLGLSFDGPASPSIVLHGLDPAPANALNSGWGFAWYPGGGYAAAVIKDPIATGNTPMNEVLRDWDRFRAALFVCHIRGAAKRVTQQDTHPFSRSYAARDWVIAHNGDLEPARARTLPLGASPVFEPVGRTDSEHAFCWLLTQIHDRGARRLADLEWHDLHAMFRELDAIGTTNFLFTDGQDLVAYCDEEGFNGLHVLRRLPPFPAEGVLSSSVVELTLPDGADKNRTMVVFSSSPLSNEPWKPIERGQMMVARGGQITWDSSKVPARKVRTASTILESSRGHVGHADATIARPGPMPPERAEPKALELERRMIVTHETTYTYEQSVERSTHQLRLKPVHDEMQSLLDFKLEVEPVTQMQHFEDVFSNRATRFTINKPYQLFKVVARSEVKLLRPELLDLNKLRTTLPLVWMPWQRQMMTPYLLPAELPEPQLRELSDFGMSFAERQDFDLIATLVDMNTTIYRDFVYLTGSTTLATTPFDVYSSRRGVCQDFANLFICLARLLGIAARYRVGYIYTGGDYENKMQSDASHAWAELYLPWVGWRGFDPTNGCLAGLDHVRVACGRNYGDATPTQGTIFKGGGGETLQVSVRVEEQP